MAGTLAAYIEMAIASQQASIIYAQRLGDLLLAASIGYQVDTPEKLRLEHETVKRCLATMRAQLAELEAALVLDALPADQVH